MTYRADIDGLRAIAVVAVVLYHLGVPGFSGGYVGVDVFFVISGYLICGLIAKDLREGRFSLADFYKRRIMRIVPALTAMLIATSVLAHIYFLPEEYKEFSASLLSAVASLSNMYFAGTAGYFGAPAEAKPLLHTWSLGVEEQFYLVAPLLLLLLHRFAPARVRSALVGATALSLLLFLAVMSRNTTFAFYLAPCRAWELLMGALLSTAGLRAPAAAALRNACGLAGLGLVAGAIVFGAPASPLPVMSLLASLGAVAIIASSEHAPSWAGRLLALRPVVFVGLISYSLYLWHWPVIVFQRTDGFLVHGPSDEVSKAAVLALSLGLAVLSWRFVEQPFRTATRTAPRLAVFGGGAAASAAMLAGAVAIFALHGLPGRFSPRVDAIGAYLAYDPNPSFRTGRCYLSTNRQSFEAAACLHLAADRPNYLLLGDSHAAHLWSGLSAVLPGVNLMQATAATCRPLVGQPSPFDTRACPKLLDLVFNTFLPHAKVDRILLSASWKDEDLPGLAATLDVLRAQGAAVTVLGPIVEYDEALPRLLADEIRRGDPLLAARMRTPGIAERDARMRKLVQTRGASYLSVYDAVCHGAVCDEFAGGDVPLQFDAGHLTAAGSLKVALRLRDDLAPEAATPTPSEDVRFATAPALRATQDPQAGAAARL